MVLVYPCDRNDIYWQNCSNYEKVIATTVLWMDTRREVVASEKNFFFLKLKRFQKGLPALEWASWMGNPDGPPGEGNHLPGQVPSFFPAYHPWVQNFGILNIWSWFMMFNECQSGQSTSTRTTPSSSQCVHRQVRCCWTTLGVRSANTGKTSRYTSSCDNRQSWQ